MIGRCSGSYRRVCISACFSRLCFSRLCFSTTFITSSVQLVRSLYIQTEYQYARACLFSIVYREPPNANHPSEKRCDGDLTPDLTPDLKPLNLLVQLQKKYTFFFAACAVKSSQVKSIEKQHTRRRPRSTRRAAPHARSHAPVATLARLEGLKRESDSRRKDVVRHKELFAELQQHPKPDRDVRPPRKPLLYDIAA